LIASDNNDSNAEATASPGEHLTSGRYQKINARVFDGKWKASDLISARVHNREGRMIGSIIDLELNDQGQIAALLVELTDGVLCVFGNSIVRMDFDSFDVDPDTRALILKEHLGEEFQDFVSSID